MSTTRLIAAVGSMTMMGALLARPSVANAAAAQALPTPIEMAPISIPSNVTKDSDFPARLKSACSLMTPFTNDATFKANLTANLAGLPAACADIQAGKPLSAADIASLRAFWTDPSQAEDQLSKAVAAATAAKALAKSSAEPAAAAPSALPVSSGSLESDIIQGLADFVYDRAKQEATLYLSDQLTKALCTGVPSLFFPAVCVALPTDPTIPLGAMGSYLAAAARTDLAQLPDRTFAYSLHELGTAKEKTAEGEAMFGARLALTYYQTVRKGRTPLDVARSMHEIRIPSTVVGANTDIIKMTTVLSELVDSVQAQKGWIDMISDDLPDLPYYALGTVFTFESQYTADGAPFGALADDKIAAAVPVVTKYLIEVATLATRAANTKLAVTTPPAAGNGGGTAPSPADSSAVGLRDYAVVVTQTLAETFETGQTVVTGLGVTVSSSVAATITTLENATELGEQMLSAQSSAELVVLVIQLVDKLAANLPAGAVPSTALTDIQQLLALVAQIAQAKSADEVANVINAAAVPPAEYKVKYRKPMVALGALAGFSGGGEWVRADGGSWNGGWVVGAFAPIGLTASTPLGTWFHGGVMISVLNMGAMVSARFSQDLMTTTTATGPTTTTIQTDPEARWANVLAPGLFLTLGIARSPFSLAFGGQVVPEARQLTTVSASGATTTSTAPAIQLLGALCVDVPIFDF